MTEDEAFIRTIVDRPGDDLPRLVYADWLDERDDMRGMYLREEIVWVKAGRPDTGYEANVLCWLSASLDPVWVARVSRPPVGVWADDAGFRESSPGVSAEQLDAVELAAEVRLPTQFRALMQNMTGGLPTADRFPHPDGSLLGPLRRFVWCGEGNGFELVNNIVTCRRRNERHRDEMVPLCPADWGDYSQIAIGCGQQNSGVVYLLHSSPLPEPATKIADSLSAFLASLTTVVYSNDDSAGVAFDF